VQKVDDTYTFDWWMRQANSTTKFTDSIGTNNVRGTA
jgi:hypothetical protein